MAENPGIEKSPEEVAREKMVAELRDISFSLRSGTGTGETVSPHSLSLLLSQTANEVEDLGKRAVPKSEVKFREAWVKFHDAINETLDVMNDPFKAPELTMETIPALLYASWEFQVEWIVMNRG